MTADEAFADAHRVLHETFGYSEFRSGQEEVLRVLLGGENCLAVMPTGAGKSLCFQIPALVRGGLTIVVSPLVALMEDQVAALRLAGVPAEAINSLRSGEQNGESWRRVRAGDIRLLYLSPERLMSTGVLDTLRALPLTMFVIDEAHCISRWGPSFRTDYESLGGLREIFPGVPVAAFTATADESTREDIAGRLFGGDGQVFVAGFDRPNIRLTVELRDNWKRQLRDFVRARPGDCGIVYCLSRKKTEEAAAYLVSEGVDALSYHAGMAEGARKANQYRFMTDPGVVMVATIAFGMGIDKPDVRYVFHANLPGNTEAYYQELGRAGRDGLAADAFMLYGLDDIRQRRMFIEDENSSEDHRRREHKRLDALIAYCEAPECRRRPLLSYFGDTIEPCGNCDICLDPPVMADGTELGQKALSAIYRTGQRFGASHITDVLRGADNERIRKFRHEELPTYGVGGDISSQQWRSILRQLVAADFLRLDIAGFGGLTISDKGKELIRGDASFRYRADRVGKKTESSSRKRAAVAELTDPGNVDLYQTLKQLRAQLSRKRGVPAYVVFPDKALIEMARHRPGDEVEFAAIYGVGRAKLEEFSETFLAAIAAHV
jgi:ATP-dependent DNA helicase RecQ